MSFGIPSIGDFVAGKVEKVEKSLLAIDIDHNGVSDFVEIKAEFEKDLPIVQALEAKLTPEILAKLINLVEPGLVTVQEISVAEAAMGRIVKRVETLPAIVEAAKAALK